MILIRIFLIGLIVYLLVRSFMRFGEEAVQGKDYSKPETGGKPETKKISKNVGEYVDFEEVKEANKENS
jgi:hypothetical protein